VRTIFRAKCTRLQDFAYTLYNLKIFPGGDAPGPLSSKKGGAGDGNERERERKGTIEKRKREVKKKEGNLGRS